MKLYISRIVTDNSKILYDNLSKLNNINIVDNIIDSDIVIIVPGGLDTFNDLFFGIKNNKRIILFNDIYYFSSMIRNLYKMYEDGFIDKNLSSYLEIESEIDSVVNIIKEME